MKPEKTCCQSDSSEKSPVKTGVKISQGEKKIKMQTD